MAARCIPPKFCHARPPREAHHAPPSLLPAPSPQSTSWNTDRQQSTNGITAFFSLPCLCNTPSRYNCGNGMHLHAPAALGPVHGAPLCYFTFAGPNGQIWLIEMAEPHLARKGGRSTRNSSEMLGRWDSLAAVQPGRRCCRLRFGNNPSSPGSRWGVEAWNLPPTAYPASAQRSESEF